MRFLTHAAYRIIQDIRTCLQPQQTSSHQHIAYMIEVESLRRTIPRVSYIFLFIPSTSFTTSQLTFYTVQQKLKKFSPQKDVTSGRSERDNFKTQELLYRP